MDMSVLNRDERKELNEKILNITTLIKEEYAELSEFLNEMPEVIIDKKNTEITSKDLTAYYDSLNSILNKYITPFQ